MSAPVAAEAQSPGGVGVVPAASFLAPLPPPPSSKPAPGGKPPASSSTRGPRNGLRAGAAPPQRRRSSFTSGAGGCSRGGPRRRRATSDCEPVLPCNFLLGGNIFDPLNLNSLLDEEVNRALNAASPEPAAGPRRSSTSSPVPQLLPPPPPSSSSTRDPAVRILRPRDITDPLCLTCDPSSDPGPGRSRKRHRPHRHTAPQPLPASDPRPSTTAAASRFQYGNYRRYYGYRTPARSEDPRLRLLLQRPHWIRGRALLDVGCNEGRLALSLARSLRPARLLGLDIDPALVRCARRNLRREQGPGQEQRPAGAPAFPQALAACRGPIAAPPLLPEEGGGEPEAQGHDFPHNVHFVQGNYVLERDELLETQSPEFDVILCLSLTKWVHLNWGDEGLKRMFKRIYRHLHPGGILILEPQPWASYGKRKKLTETIFKNYQQITLKPDQFTSYLLSPEVGFSSYELLGTPQSSSKGFQRPVYAFHKGRPVAQ
ncbi:7SK snRNA methylphosphate capping enzyme [Rhinatrema bivittatum]|uniref:7SK snRNA methylphosphate capping enzyme n=1 Tax=Rhinatrema bivittatum TaxID=194408 RepID=UPI001126E2A6|nr:7SK snRNA methylphosphate capping enzyme [Rhinatrema bivittatum]